VVAMMLIWLLLCLSGVVTALGFGQIANAAHVSGLVLGCVSGAVFALLARQRAA
ncbi:MAG: rhomboid family intramembrane serine protease, partial [Gammaproteobacteria bacterium]|nr:rhomboid family intramembrane serine protease [Gammaproteobacteria bacterium]